MTLLKSFGKLVYSPNSHLGNPEKWLILMCDDEISKYYRHLFQKEYPWKGKLIRPVFGAHISIIRGEYVPKHHLWGLDTNKIIPFEYYDGVQDNGKYYWLKVKCEYLENLRLAYGLNKYPQYGYHLTIGCLAG